MFIWQIIIVNFFATCKEIKTPVFLCFFLLFLECIEWERWSVMIEYPADFSKCTALGQEGSIVTCCCVTNLRKFSNLIPHYFWGSGTWALLDWLRFPHEVITKLQASGCNLRRFDWGWGIWEARSHDCWREIFSSLPGDPFWGSLRHSMGSSRVSDPRMSERACPRRKPQSL